MPEKIRIDIIQKILFCIRLSKISDINITSINSANIVQTITNSIECGFDTFPK